MKRGAPCRHCGSPAKGRPCWYERAPFEKHDPPCEGEASAKAARVRERWAILSNLVAGLCIVLAAAVIWLACTI